MRDSESLELAAALGADICGFIFHPKSPRYIDPSAAGKLPSFQMKRAGVFVAQAYDEILQISRAAGLDLIQLHGGQDEACALKLGKERVIRAVWPERFENTDALNEYLKKASASAGFFLLDAGVNLGGSGKSISLDILKNIESPLPWLLAGGLSPDYIPVEAVKPDGLDINSGLESSPGRKEPDLMRSFFENLNSKLNNGAQE